MQQDGRKKTKGFGEREKINKAERRLMFGCYTDAEIGRNNLMHKLAVIRPIGARWLNRKATQCLCDDT